MVGFVFDKFVFDKVVDGFVEQFFGKPDESGEEVENIETAISFSDSDAKSVLLKNINGSVKISSWEQPEIHVKATKKVKFRDPQKGREYAQNVRVNVDKIEGRVEIVTEHPKGSTPKYIKSVSVDYDIKIPSKVDIDLEASNLNGNISISGIKGSLKSNTLNGSLLLESIYGYGKVEAKTTNGNINAKFHLLEGSGEFHTVNGSIEIQIPNLPNLPNLPKTEANEVNSIPINSHTVNGSISIKLPLDFQANIEATVVNGFINCELPVAVQGKLERRSLKGKINGGGKEMALGTVNGNINVRVY